MTRVELPDLGRWAPQRTDAQRWEPPRKLTVVVAPHPDDETLLSGGLIAHQARAGVPVIVLAVTDGEAAYPGDPDGLARQRRREQRQALRALAGEELPVLRLGLPDGRVEDHHSSLVAAIAEHVTVDSLVVAPWRLDHPCDHEAVGRAAHEAAGRCGAALAEGLFWAWHHRQPQEMVSRLRELPLSRREVERRRCALSHHHSQVAGDGASTPVLHSGVLGPFDWPSEYFILSNEGDDPL